MKRLVVLLLMLVLTLSCVSVQAASVGAMTDENTYIDESGTVYTYQDDKLYQLIDGKLYEVVTGNEQSIIDVMKKRPGSEVPDGEVMAQAQGLISSTIGVALSVIIYVFFALTAFTTACDFAYIGVPPIRSVLYDASSATANLHTSVMHGVAQYQSQRAQQAAMRGDQIGAARLQNAAAQSEAIGNYRDQNWFGNRENMERAQNSIKGSRCFISRELKSLVNAGQIQVNVTNNAFPGMPQAVPSSRNIILMYLKRRAVSIVVIVVVFMLLVTSSVFTDFGLNIGNMIYRTAAKFLGF